MDDLVGLEVQLPLAEDISHEIQRCSTKGWQEHPNYRCQRGMTRMLTLLGQVAVNVLLGPEPGNKVLREDLLSSTLCLLHGY